MFGSFKVQRPIASNSSLLGEDVLNTKKALEKIGLYRVPDWGMTPYPDAGMFEGLKGFQRENGLKVDGVMKPEGPTEGKLGEVLKMIGGGNGNRPEKTFTPRTKKPPRHILLPHREDDPKPEMRLLPHLETDPKPGLELKASSSDGEGGVEAHVEDVDPNVGNRTKPTTPEKEKTPDYKWKDRPEKNLFSGEYEFDVKGPVRVDAISHTVGADGLRYHIDWHGLDERGEVIPEFRDPGRKPKPYGGHLPPMGIPKSDIFEQPYDNPHGYRVRIWIPPQASVNGNSAGPYLNIYGVEGKVLERKGR